VEDIVKIDEEVDGHTAAKPESDVVIDVINVCKRFGDTEALIDMSLAVRRRETICIIGPSGSGKSTLLRAINHLECIDSGEIFVNNHLIGHRRVGDKLVDDSDTNVARQRREIGMVFQRFNLFPHLTVLDNVMCGPRRVRNMKRTEAKALAEELLEQVGLSDKRASYPLHLSGGQQQRVAIARALAMRPSVMLFDEPTSALDPETVGEVLDVMRELAVNGMTMVIATHELGFAREAADRIVMMDHGRMIEDSPPAHLFSPEAHPRTRAFLARML
jgi:polar amino acid transport system ATP-binding protein